MPSSVFRSAWRKPWICERIFSDTASPDASSPARLIRMPEESFSTSLVMLQSWNFKVRCAKIALTLWLIIMFPP